MHSSKYSHGITNFMQQDNEIRKTKICKTTRKYVKLKRMAHGHGRVKKYLLLILRELMSWK
jgi:hypothetical protein